MNHVPRKRFGQHFLRDASVVDAIVTAIAPAPSDRIVEIGPGLGALTRPLAARVDRLHAIEIDRDIAARLRQEYPPDRVIVHVGDALDFDFTALGSELRVVGNLPYNISTPLLFHLARHAAAIRDIHVMLQREVVERMVARPSGAEYGRLSVMLQYRFEMKRLFIVPAGAFHPAPKVQSAVVRLVPFAKLPYPAQSEERLAKLVAAAFSQRRKTLRNSLKAFFTGSDWKRLGIDPGLRAETLSVEEFVRLANEPVAGVSPSCAG